MAVTVDQATTPPLPATVTQEVHPLPGGDTVGGAPTTARYTRLRVHAKGGLGQVWLARDGDLGREVALKEVRADRAGSAIVEARFLEEARITGQLEHPGIVPVYELSRREDGQPFYTMRFVRGRTLSAAVADYHARRQAKAAQPLDLLTLLNAFVSICNALAYAHSRGVIHRDLKGQNVVVGSFGEVLVLDWGLAKVLSGSETAGELPPPTLEGLEDRQATMPGQALGTPGYMAPEQAEGRLDLMDARTDVYGLGAILYEILTGRPPFAGMEVMDFLRRVGQEMPTPPRRLVAGTSPALEAVCLKALAKRPADRYASAADLGRDVQRWLAGEPVAAYPEPMLTRVRRWVRRHRTLVTGGVVLMCAAVVALSISTWLLDREQRQTHKNYLWAEQERQAADAARQNEARAKDSAETNLYFTEIAFAYREWLANNLTRTRLFLGNERRPDLRGWEWAYLQRLCHSELATWAGHEGHVESLAYSPDGRLVATASNDKTVKIWDVRSGAEVRTYRGHEASVRAVAFSPSGKRLASTDGKTIRIWDPHSGQEDQVLPAKDAYRLAFAPDGGKLARVSTYEMQLLDLATGQAVWSHEDFMANLECVAFSPDGRRLATGTQQRIDVLPVIKIWDAATGQELLALRDHGSTIQGLAFSPDGARLASASSDKTARLWDVATGKPLLTFTGHDHWVYTAAFSPDGRYVATGSFDQTIKIWEAASGQVVRTYRGHAHGISCLAFSPDGRLLTSGSYDRTARLWDASAAQEALVLAGHRYDVAHLAFSPDGHHLASGGRDNRVLIWDLHTGQAQRERDLGTCPLAVVYRSDGQRLATATVLDSLLSNQARIQIWQTTTGKELHARSIHANGLAIREDLQQVATFVYSSTEVVLRDLATGQEQHRLRGHVAPVVACAYSPDGGRLATSARLDPKGATSAEIKIWDTATGQELATLTGHTDAIVRLAFSTDGRRLASGSNDRSIKLWDTSTYKELQTLSGHPAGISGLAFAPDGKRLASTGFVDTAVRLWDTATGYEILSLRGHAENISAVAFDRDGWRLATGGQDGTLRVWDARELTEAVRATRRAPAAANQQAWHRREAEACEASGQWRAALFHWQRLVEAQAEDPDLRQRRGRAFAALGDWSKALADFDFYLERNSNDAAAWNARGQAALRLERNDEALANFAKASRLSAKEGTYRLNEFLACMRAGQKERAGQSYAEALRLTPLWGWFVRSFAGVQRDPGAVARWRALATDLTKDLHAEPSPPAWLYLARGLAHAGGEFWDQALADFVRATQLQQDDWEAWRSLALIYCTRQDGKKAADACTRGLEHKPKEWSFYYLRGTALGFMLAELEGGLADFSKAIELGAPGWACWVNRGDLHAMLEKSDLAEADYKRVVDVGAKDPDAWQARAQFYRTHQKLDLATADFSRAIELAPKNGDLWRLRAELHAQARRLDQAIADYSQAIELLPDLVLFREKRAQLYGELRQWEKAIPDYSRVVETFPRSPSAYHQRGIAYANLNQFEKAIADYTAAIERNERGWTVWYNRGVSRSQLNQQELAVADFTQAIALESKIWQIFDARGIAHGRLAQFDRAAEDFARAADLQPAEPFLWYRRAVAHLGAGNAQGYRQACAAMLEQAKKKENPAFASQLAYACVPAPDALADFAPLVPLAEAAVPLWKGNSRILGAVLYRHGKYEAALAPFEESAKDFAPRAWDWFFLAMIHYRLGHGGDARRCLATGEQWLKDHDLGWEERVETQALEREARRLIRGID